MTPSRSRSRAHASLPTGKRFRLPAGSALKTGVALGLAGLLAGLLAVPGARAENSDPAALAAVHAAVNAELHAAQTDHTAWEYRDHDVQPGADKISQVIETPKGDLSRLLILNGKPLTGSAEQTEMQRIRDFVDSPSEQAHKRKDAQHDGAQARELLTMLPEAFVWTIAGQNEKEVALRYRPNPDFQPGDMQARVMGLMAGEMVVARAGDRIQSLRGTLTDDLRIGFGILGKLNRGGTFDIERRELAPGLWQITETHVHIAGHALLFKTIGQEEDETKGDFHLSTAPNLQVAEEQIFRQ